MGFKEQKPSLEVTITMELARSALAGVQMMTGVHPIVLAAIMGQILGESLACADCCAEETDPEAFAKVKGYRETFMANFDLSYKDHVDEHMKGRRAMQSATDMLSKVCESHKTKGGGLVLWV